METVELLKELSLATGITGYRGPNNVQDVVSNHLEPHVDRIDRDRLGSVVGYKAGHRTAERRYKIMLAAHLDEIGAMVTKVDRGVLRFTKVGGLDARVLMGQEVIVHAKRGEVALAGVVGSIPPHLQTRRDSGVDIEKMHIDVGLPESEVAELVQVGDVVSFVGYPTELLNGLVCAKAMDNRSSVAAMVLCMAQLQSLSHLWDVYAVATADEEWGNYVGATTQAYRIQPDVALVIDVTFANVDEIDVKLNEGPVLNMGPSNHPVVRKHLIQVCDDLELKYQSEIMPSGAGTDAYAIEISREGVPTVLISVPSKYMHSPIEVVHHKDVERIGRLMAHFIASLDESFVEMLIPTVE